MNRTTGVVDGPTPASPQQIRNVALVGPPGSGKSTLFEHLVAARSEGRRPKDDDTAASTGLTAASFASGEVVVNLIDTPGNPDFVGEVRAGLRAADAALFVVSGADGVDEPTRMLWRECTAAGMPRAIAVTRLEQARGDFAETVAAARRTFGDVRAIAEPVQPEGPGTEVTGLVDLIAERDGDVLEASPAGSRATTTSHRSSSRHSSTEVAPPAQSAALGSVTSTTSAASARTRSSAASVAPTPCSPAPIEIVRPATVASAMTGHAVVDPNGVIVPRS